MCLLVGGVFRISYRLRLSCNATQLLHLRQRGKRVGTWYRSSQAVSEPFYPCWSSIRFSKKGAVYETETGYL